MLGSFRSDRSWRFDVGVDRLWERLSATDEYRSWWPWLRSFRAPGGFEPDAEWTCAVAPPLPYVLRFTVRLDHVEPHRLVAASVDGDIGGTATLTIDGDDATSSARLVSSLHPRHPVLRGVGVVARPVIEHGHDWVLDQGRRQFTERAFG